MLFLTDDISLPYIRVFIVAPFCSATMHAIAAFKTHELAHHKRLRGVLQVDASVDNPVGLEHYVEPATQFVQWAFKTPAERAEVWQAACHDTELGAKHF